MTDTIFALATPFGRSGVAVIRISGSAANDSLSHFGITPLPAPRKAHYCSFILPASDEVLDRGLVLSFPAPHSFTGEDCIEFQIHGSIAVIKKVLAELSGLPHFRMAEPGEFARRAFLNNKFDLTAAEGLVDLIEAETEMQRQQASHSALGHAAKFYNQLRSEIIHSLAFLEAYIDFPDEDIPPSVYAQVEDEVAKVTLTIQTILANSENAEKIREGFTVVILGAPNAGKSTLLNALAKRDAAIVSDRAGTTRDLIEVHLDLHGLPVTLIDTAGIRETSDDIESEGIKRALAKAEHADVKLVLFDSTLPLDPSTRAIIDDTTIVVFTKAEQQKVPSAPPNSMRCLNQLSVSALDSSTLSPLLLAIENHLAIHAKPTEAAVVTRQRHRDHLVAALDQLALFEGEKSLELQCERIRLAAVEVGKITGHIQVDELLGVIFSSFCIGK
jgi:tRNA modification GTPase